MSTDSSIKSSKSLSCNVYGYILREHCQLTRMLWRIILCIDINWNQLRRNLKLIQSPEMLCHFYLKFRKQHQFQPCLKKRVVQMLKTYYSRYETLIKPYKKRHTVPSYQQKLDMFRKEARKKLFDISSCICDNFSSCSCLRYM